MALCPDELDAIAEHLLSAEAERREVPSLAQTHGELSLDEGYQVQDEIIARKLKAGDRLIGWKLGLTSKEKQKAMGVFEPVYGALFASTLLPECEVNVSELIHPRVEPEIAVVMGEDLEGPDVTPAQALAALRWVLPALEVIDSRYKDFKFTLPDVVADNASTARAVTGTRPVPAEGLDLATIGVVFLKNGELITTAAGAAVLGDPAIALARLANHLARRGQKLKAGQLVFTGALTAATFVAPGDVVEARFAALGSVSLRVVAR